VYTCVCMESGFPSPRPNCSCRAEHPSIKASNFFPSLGNCGHVLLWDVVYRDKGCCSSE
jgi:hypothetical protein